VPLARASADQGGDSEIVLACHMQAEFSLIGRNLLAGEAKRAACKGSSSLYWNS
jgi:hypothetical protein